MLDGVRVAPSLCQLIDTGSEAVKAQSNLAAVPKATTVSAGSLVNAAEISILLSIAC